MVLEIRETFVNETKGYQFGNSAWYEPYTDNRGRLFRSLQREYGRCVSKVRNEAQGDKAVGWVFQKRMEYEDARQSWRKEDRTYVREVWVEVREVAGEYEEVA
jgi:hypothetical protein